jgi:hypothetical protein
VIARTNLRIIFPEFANPAQATVGVEPLASNAADRAARRPCPMNVAAVRSGRQTRTRLRYKANKLPTKYEVNRSPVALGAMTEVGREARHADYDSDSLCLVIVRRVPGWTQVWTQLLSRTHSGRGPSARANGWDEGAGFDGQPARGDRRAASTCRAWPVQD